MNNHKNNLIKDASIVALSVLIAIILLKTGVFINILASSKSLELFGSFIAGMFFTSIFTTAPAMATLGEIARANSVVLTALFGGMGAVVGDLIIFRFVRNRFSEQLMELIKHQGAGKRIKMLFKLKFFRWLTFFAGGLIIASPLPDELGISFLGFSKIKTSLFIPMSFVFKFSGIFIIGFIAKSVFNN